MMHNRYLMLHVLTLSCHPAGMTRARGEPQHREASFGDAVYYKCVYPPESQAISCCNN